MKINEKNLCVFAKKPPYDMDGFLRKRGEGNRAFQKRYFVLKGNLLFYFETQYDKEPLGLIIVEGCTIELTEDVESYCFEIAFNGNRTYVLATDTQESMEAWMKALTCAGYEYRRAILENLQRKLNELEESKNRAVSATPNARPNPPPRRQNPFDRRAPPLPPDAKSNGKTGVALPSMAFSVEHFGQSLTLDNGNNNNTNCSRTDAGRRSEFFVPAAAVTPIAPTVLPRSNNNNSGKDNKMLQEQRRAKAMAAFKERHAFFNQIVMRDINDYRARLKPLVDI
ncbi:sesquipedalian-1 [Scaptodrosophila lebanonensis]|uniref:Sesquipedalian-1 n=1 Tax=Drosophila lebanonensis TaxID=7225 RepID=A0A6J2TLT2_DROLE|nr:sesquipedalian-1 [Scaptodrosophila lebanonensis]